MDLYSVLIAKAISQKIDSSKKLEKLKDEVCSLFHSSVPSNADIRSAYESMVSEKKISRNHILEKVLKGKRIRTLSGVAVVAVLTKSYPCTGKCLYCPDEESMPKSYLSNEPAVMRAITVNFDPYDQVIKRLHALKLNGHAIDKIELIVMGGTFSNLPDKYRYWFIKECFRAANEYKVSHQSQATDQEMVGLEKMKKLLFEEQNKNETSNQRIIGLTLETRPDCIDEQEIMKFRELGCTRVEIGVQSVFDSVLKRNKRGHGVKEIVTATRLLKDAGFKVGYHMMTGLYGSNIERDFENFKKIFSDQRFQPDLIKIYPCVVVENSELFNLWKDGKYIPLTENENEKLILKIKKIVPPYVRISRIIRDIPSSSVLAGPKISNLRQLIKDKVECRCIRCREVKEKYSFKESMKTRRIEYSASDGKEIFLEIISPDNKKLFSMLRLRIPSRTSNLFPEIMDSAIIRELHTYGKMAQISNSKESESPQHVGLGKKLLKLAEKIVKKEFGLNKISVISGIGVREYYEKQGYKLEGSYMVKKL